MPEGALRLDRSLQDTEQVLKSTMMECESLTAKFSDYDTQI